jgi:hypothetical protein
MTSLDDFEENYTDPKGFILFTILQTRSIFWIILFDGTYLEG